MKLYPFSVQKHAHDIEFRHNQIFNILHDIQDGETTTNEQEWDTLEKLYEDLTNLLEAVLNSRDGRIAYLTGKQIGLAKETVTWAANTRAETLIKAGKSQYLKYL